MFDNLYKFLRSRYLRSIVILSIVLLVSFLASLIAITLVKLFLIPFEGFRYFMALYLVASIVVSALAFYKLRTHHSLIRPMRLREAAKLMSLSPVTLVLLILIPLMLPEVRLCDPSMMAIWLLDFLLTAFGLVGMRVIMLIAYSILRGNARSRKNIENILVYGTGDKAVSLVPRLQNATHDRIVGFLS